MLVSGIISFWQTVDFKADSTKDVSRYQHDKNQKSRIATVDSFVLIGTHQHCVAKICNAGPRTNAYKLQNDPYKKPYKVIKCAIVLHLIKYSTRTAALYFYPILTFRVIACNFALDFDNLSRNNCAQLKPRYLEN